MTHQPWLPALLGLMLTLCSGIAAAQGNGEFDPMNPQVSTCTKFDQVCGAVFDAWKAVQSEGSPDEFVEVLLATVTGTTLPSWVLAHANDAGGVLLATPEAVNGDLNEVSLDPVNAAVVSLPFLVMGAPWFPTLDDANLALDDASNAGAAAVAPAEAGANAAVLSLPVSPEAVADAVSLQVGGALDTLHAVLPFVLEDEVLEVHLSSPAPELTPDPSGGGIAGMEGTSENLLGGQSRPDLALPLADDGLMPGSTNTRSSGPMLPALPALPAAAQLLAASIPLAAFAIAIVLLAPPLYHRLQKQKLLDHGARARLYQLVQERPGIHIEELARAAGISRSTAVYHLRLLTRHGHIVAMGARKSVHYYPNSGIADAGQRGQRALLASPRARTVASVVQHRPGITRNELAPAAGITLSTLSWHLGRLVEAGLLEDRVLPNGQRGLFPAAHLAGFLAPWQAMPPAAEPEIEAAPVPAPEPIGEPMPVSM
jgi:DNA-binding transcriptional ArsR family regulator